MTSRGYTSLFYDLTYRQSLFRELRSLRSFWNIVWCRLFLLFSFEVTITQNYQDDQHNANYQPDGNRYRASSPSGDGCNSKMYIYSLNLSHTWNDSHQKSHSDVQKLPQLSLFKLPPQMHANGWKMIHWLLTPLTVNSPSNCYPFPCKLVTKIWCFIKIGTSTW